MRSFTHDASACLHAPTARGSHAVNTLNLLSLVGGICLTTGAALAAEMEASSHDSGCQATNLADSQAQKC